jgi:hypothetical protein
MRRAFPFQPASFGLILLAAAGPAGGQGLGGAMVAPVAVPAQCAEGDLACHRLRLDAALRREADNLLRDPVPAGKGAPVDRLMASLRAAEPEAIKALGLGADALRDLAGEALRQAIQS